MAIRRIIGRPIVAIMVAVVGCGPVSRMPSVSPAEFAAEKELQEEAVLAQQLDDLERVGRIAYRILAANAALCGERVAYVPGFKLATEARFSDKLRPAAQRILGLDRFTRVISVVPGSPADLAGVQRGDVVLAVGDWQVPLADDSPRRVFRNIDNRLKRGGPSAMPDLTIWRNGETLKVRLGWQLACNFDWEVRQEDLLNAFADGTRIIVTTGMLRFTRTDEDLVTIIGHEIAHDLMEHRKRKDRNAFFGSLADLVAGSLGFDTRDDIRHAAREAFGQDYEREADYVGLYLMANAGYPLDQCANLWRRMAAATYDTGEPNWNASHPPNPERSVFINKTIAEIMRKKAAGQTLLRPER
jgi:Zn-dependent protease with chaperone function